MEIDPGRLSVLPVRALLDLHPSLIEGPREIDQELSGVLHLGARPGLEDIQHALLDRSPERMGELGALGRQEEVRAAAIAPVRLTPEESPRFQALEHPGEG